jgi:predicted nucleotidyltransferase
MVGRPCAIDLPRQGSGRCRQRRLKDILGCSRTYPRPAAEGGDLRWPGDLAADEIIASLRAHESELRRVGIRQLSLFGSMARGQTDADSDIDLVAELEPNANVGLFRLSAIESRLSQILGRKVDLRTGREAPPPIRCRTGSPTRLLGMIQRRALPRAHLRIRAPVRRRGGTSDAGAPWADIRGMGHRLRHAYDRVSFEVIWNSIETDLPALASDVRQALTKFPRPGGEAPII